MLPEGILAQFDKQARACDALGSPFTARLCRLLPECLDEGTATGRAVVGWRDGEAAALPLRLCGALHRLVLAREDDALASVYPPNPVDDGMLGAALARALVQHDAALLAGLDSPPQTNEVARASALLPGLLTVARETRLPLTLVEIGSSAGLNLSLDGFHYTFGDAQWGDPAAGVRLAPGLRGGAPDLSGDLVVAGRRGCDIRPIDLSDPAQRLRLRSFVWADQTARLERLDAAIALAVKRGIAVERQDAADFVAGQLETRPAGTVFCLMHSIMWQYMPQATQARIAGLMEQAGAAATSDSPVAWLRLEPDAAGDAAVITLDLWPGGTTRVLGRADFHGRWLDWRS
ncbi:DUF2332 family protein [Aurantimonas sp. MSK8Z-1]|uniref:DUF2332 domain-containing protein n=1 Tax=Mangrovibrevibacter kandeliae TaxID=2968473 RepID=UPI002118206F|nr:DUF2332 family protein [Aurantimonas sp. MSK8Z-1]MCW4116366.1 DUF2332 family protein [Aurantimonas sp. MSK8Z-1]